MTHKSKPLPKTGLGAGSKKAGPDTVFAAVSPSLPPFAAAKGASIFQVAATKATAEDLDKVREQIGPLDLKFITDLYQKSQNPVWVWVAISMAQHPQDIPPEAFDYLRGAATQMWKAVVDQVCSHETVRIIPGMEIDEAVSRESNVRPSLPNILQLLKLAHPGRNLIRAAAADIRDISVAVAVQNFVTNVRQPRGRSRSYLAEVLGRNSAETGPVTASIKHMEVRGRKLARITRRKKR